MESNLAKKEKKIWLSSPHLGQNEQTYVQEALDSNWVAPFGSNITDFEQGLQNYIKENKYVVALNSGTAAIHLALIMAGVGVGDEVLCQSFTFSASANPIVYLGAKPVFVDSEKDTWNMCPMLLEEAIKERILKGVKPKAIIAVHLYGMPYKAQQISIIGKKYNIPIIEDSAEALGSKVDEKYCGTFGLYGVFSFNGNKIITTSGGGTLIVNSEKEKEKAIYLATQAKDQAPHFQHSQIGYNYRMSNVLAGIGKGQLEVLEDRVKTRRRIFDRYFEELKNLDFKFLEEPKGFKSNRWLTTIQTPSFQTREKIRKTLEIKNIESRPLWKPMHLQPVFKNCKAYISGVSKNLFEKGLCLPSSSNLTEKDLGRIIEVLKKF
ncbi:aminotransferase class I/II-fold pyridoxal phosphate-dependent enzyme [uncultured Lutibacter sp.]|uniref:aminotransferase class I/II-fold pyridoxal phosphate-dependent enzyme n=1 Tax=uncultured Lutibacter sp. TaxID=437739 RepID=UPI002617E4BA|nr:aminotransferase class I/II-fold pyridoxal phosphate-dependent enzyme [uncultured Lutibacter sp.]